MDATLSETQRLLRDSLRDYLRKEAPFDRVRELERAGGVDETLWAHLVDAGFLALPFAERHDGEAGELIDAAIMLEELTRRAAIPASRQTHRASKPAAAKAASSSSSGK